MSNLETFRELLNDGYLIKRKPFLVASIVEEGLARQRAGLPIPQDRQFLLDPSNWDEMVIILRHPKSGEEALVVTGDEAVVHLASDEYERQMKPIGSWIRVHCMTQGGASPNAPIYRLDKLIPSLDGLRGWTFEAGDTPSQFVVSTKMDEIDADAQQTTIDEITSLLDCLAAALGIGIRIWHLSASHIPRSYPAVSFGKVVKVLPALTDDEKQRIEEYLTSQQKRSVAQICLHVAFTNP